jgi:hypothetical protein
MPRAGSGRRSAAVSEGTAPARRAEEPTVTTARPTHGLGPVRRHRARIAAVTVAAVAVVASSSGASVAASPSAAPDAAGTPGGGSWAVLTTSAAGGTTTADGWLRLTGNGTGERTAVLDQTTYPTDRQLEVTFDYRASGAPGGAGDGISMFFVDGATNDPFTHAGDGGSGLGYARSLGGACGTIGGYVGVGLDVFGNFTSTTFGNTGGVGNGQANSVGVRGSGNATCSGSAQYPWIAGGALPAELGTVSTAAADGSDAGVDPATDDDSLFRRVRVTLLPVGTTAHLTVAMTPVAAKDGEPGDLEEVLATDLSVPGQVDLPATLKLGFGASTGLATEYHDLRDVTVRTTPVADVAMTADLEPSTPGSAGLAPGNFLPGDPVRLALTATNLGPAAVDQADQARSRVYDDLTASGLTDISWVCTAQGGATCLTPSGTGPVVAADWTGPAGSSVTVVVTGTASALAQGAQSTTATAPTDLVANSVDPAGSTGFIDLDLTNNTAAPLSWSVHAAPRITATLASRRPISRYGWFRDPVQVTFSCAPSGPALAGPCPGPVDLFRDGAGQSVTRTVTDAVGAVGQAVVTGVNIDRVPPTVRLKGVRNGGVYAAAHPPRPRCVASDRLSGLAGCRVRKHRLRAGGITTVVYIAVARDQAGNKKSTRVVVILR